MSLPEVGTVLHARYTDGEFYKAEVTAIAKKRRHAPVKVAFKGYEGEDAWVPLHDLKCKAYGLKGVKEDTKHEDASTSKPKKKVFPHDLPAIGERVSVKESGGKRAPAQVVGAWLEVRLSDGTTKWVDSSEVEARYKCTACNMTFGTEDARDHHWWDAHVVTCKDCGRIFDNETLRDEHWWEEHIVYCKQCGKICSDIAHLVQHTKDVHAMTCKQCGKTCSSIKSLVQHARDVHQYTQNLIQT